MIETTATVGEDGTVRVAAVGFAPGRIVRVTIQAEAEEEFETRDSNPDVEDFA